MLKRKETVLAASLAAFGLALAGLALADEDSPLHKLMEQVQAKNTIITKAVRTPVAYKKSQKAAADAAKDLARLGKEARDFTEPAKKEKQPQEKWTGLMDEFIKQSEGFAKKVGAAGTTQAQAKDAFRAVSKSCSNCHDVFRKEEE